MLSENYGIKVVYKADMCCTDGKTIFLPVLGDKADQKIIDAFPGMIDHESAHVLDTDFAVLDEFEKSKDPHRRKLHALLNIVEDARVERFMTNRWRGTKVNLSKCHEWGYGDLLSNWDKLTQWGRFSQICGAIACHEDGYFAAEEMEKRDPELWDWALKVKPMLRQAAGLPDTKAAMQLAKDILAKIHELAEEEDPPPQQGGDEEQQNSEEGDDDQEGQGGDSEASQDGDDQSQGKGDEDDQEDSDGAGDGSDDQDEEDEQPAAGSYRQGDGTEDEESEDESQNVPECLKPDFEPSEEDHKEDEQVSSRQEQMRRAAKASCPQHSGQYLVYSTERDQIIPVTGGDRDKAMQLLMESRHITHVMRQKMMRNLIALTRAKWEANQERGRINPRALHRVVTGTSKKVFRKRVEAPKFDTRATLLVDHSYSMCGRKLQLAASSALLFGEVLNQIGIPFEVLGFSTSTSYTEGERIYRNASHEDQMTFSRWGGLWIGIYKSFEDDWNSSKHRCVNMERNQHHNTYDGESVRLAAQRLLRYPERRRILFLFNDGEPCPNVQHFMNVHDEYAKDVAAEVERAVELFAVGIQSDTVANYYSNSVCINSLEDLPKVMIGELDRMLKKMQRQLMAS
jgi:cobaltochelatase CobT